jgi:hypothetical protein
LGSLNGRASNIDYREVAKNAKNTLGLEIGLYLVFADEELNAAAAPEGLKVENPNWHP